MRSNNIICLMGPTGSGKTDVAISLAERENFAIISVDSAMVYRGMDIGTAKPPADILQRAPHRLINIRDPEDTYSAADFVTDCHREIAAIIHEGKRPLLVGGTMLYFRALMQGLSILPSANVDVRHAIECEAAEHGWLALHEELQRVDPRAAARIHPNDPQRLSRALEVYRVTGIPLSTHWQAEATSNKQDYAFTSIAIVPEDRAQLHARIATRFNKMLDDGFVDEVRLLMQRPLLTMESPSMRAVGYRQTWEYLCGDIDEKTYHEKAIAATRQLAKRQLTWLRSWENITVVATPSDAFKKITTERD